MDSTPLVQSTLLTHPIKANFKPPPQVESAVVRITPKTGSEKPKFNFAEMDGMLRVRIPF
jgi:16S rRNA A1518/A1519 N6-dimethyltransferase RsmA/KsgA/DIM1 with predicted DNA glycosylase/AP lyase activity